MSLSEAINAFYYDMTLEELRAMNGDAVCPDISYNSLLYLELIFSMNGKCTASKIADLLYVSRPAVTLKINELIKQGFVTKTPDPEDGRQYLLSVNEEAVPKYKVYRKQDNMAIQKISEQ